MVSIIATRLLKLAYGNKSRLILPPITKCLLVGSRGSARNSVILGVVFGVLQNCITVQISVFCDLYSGRFCSRTI